MHYAISHQSSRYDFLYCTSRKRLLKHTLLHVQKGLLLVKLGKLEYALEAGATFWLPFDTLCSLTFFPNSQIQQVELSSRVQLPLPSQGGFVVTNTLTQEIMYRLADKSRNVHADSDLLTVLKSEIVNLSPKLTESELTQNINLWSWDKLDSVLSTEQQLVLKVRAADKMMLSGKKRPEIVKLLFNNSEQTFQQLENIVLGRK